MLSSDVNMTRVRVVNRVLYLFFFHNSKITLKYVRCSNTYGLITNRAVVQVLGSLVGPPGW